MAQKTIETRSAKIAWGSDLEGAANAVSANGEDTVQEGSEISRQIVAALEQLPLFERAALFLRDVERLPLGAVADKLDCSIPTARLHIAKGRIVLLRRLQGLPRCDGLVSLRQIAARGSDPVAIGWRSSGSG